MNLNQLEYLTTTISTGSFTSAAKKLFITPQAVSKAISELEKELQVSLFTKSGRGIEPTNYCELLAPKAKEILQSCEDLKAYADILLTEADKETLATGKLDIAVVSSPYEGGVITREFFDDFESSYPKVSLSVGYYSSSTSLVALQEGHVDAAIILGRYRRHDYLCIKLFDARLCIATSKTHPLAQKGEVSLADISKFQIAKPADIRFVYPTLRDHFKELGATPDFHELPPLTENHSSFFSKHGVIFVTYDTSIISRFSDVVFTPLGDQLSISIPICIVVKKEKNEKAVRLLQRHLVKAVKSKEYIIL